MTIPLIAVVLDPPEISDPSNFETKADNLLNVDLPQLTVEYNASVTALNDVVDDLDAKIAMAGFAATSTTSVAIGTGSKSWTIQTGLSYVTSSFIKARYDATNWMWGEVASYNSATGALVVTVAQVTGSGTYAAWSFSLAEPIGARPDLSTGATVAVGTSNSEFVSPGSLADSMAPVVATVTGTINSDLSNHRFFDWLLSGSIVLGLPSATRDGATIIRRIQQPASGGAYTLSRHASIKKGAELDLTLSTGANKVDYIASVIRGGVEEITGITRDMSA